MKKFILTLCITAIASLIMAQKTPFANYKGSQIPPSRSILAACLDEKGTFDFPFTIGGLTVTLSGTGSLTNYAPGWPSCDLFCKANCMWLGSEGPGTMTNTFSLPVNDVVYTFTGADVGEIITITTNAGTVSLTYTDGSCPAYVSFAGNVISFVGEGDYGAGGRILIHSSSDFTSVTFSHNGEGNGTVFTMCADTLNAEPVPVSNWAVFIGIGLILVFAAVRFRKMV